MAKILLLLIFAALCGTGVCKAQQNNRSSGNTTYYVDPQSGSDENAGTAQDAAWKTMARVNIMHFTTGDSILFAAGKSIFGHMLLEKTMGDLDHPVVVSSYGSGKATINGGAGDGISIVDGGFIKVRNLKVVGCGRKEGSNGTGIKLSGSRSVEVDDVDVSGFRVSGIQVMDCSSTRIIHVFAHENGYAGISTTASDLNAPHKKNLYIGYCRAENNAGDPKNLTNQSGNGIVVNRVDDVMVEYCSATNNGWDMPRKGNGPVGIWGWNCDNLTIQHCISHHNKSPGLDGGGFDLDGAMTNSVLQYNLSYSNEGTGYLLCQFGRAGFWDNNIVRYNISINDGLRNLHCGIAVANGSKQLTGAQIYNNTVINVGYAVVSVYGNPEATYRNNIFVAGIDVLRGDLKNSRFSNNVYWNTGKDGGGCFYRGTTKSYRTLQDWAYGTDQEIANGELVGMFKDPLLVMPPAGMKLPTDPQDLARFSLCRLLPRSPCISSGAAIPKNGGLDFFGNPVPTEKPSLGAHEASKGRATPLSPQK